MIRILTILLVLAWFAGDGEKEGRTGNELYSEERFGAAVEAYERGLASLSENAPRMLRYGLLNNLGAALLKSGELEASGDAFARALAAAPEAVDVARTSYNAGNTAYAAENLEAALAHYRESLLANPDNEEAKFNYEFVKRQLDRQQQEQQNQGGDQNDRNDQEQEQEQEQQSGSQEQEQEQEQPQNQDQQEQSGGQDQQEASQQGEEPREGQAEAEQSGTELSQEEAQRILDALRNEEEQLLRQVQRPKSRPRQVDKDW